MTTAPGLDVETITIQLSEAVSYAAWAVAGVLAVMAALIGVSGWFLRREIVKNDKAHDEMKRDIKTVESDIKKLLAGLGRVEGMLNKMTR